MNITVFTPTYNRAYIIGKLYSSLKRQTYHDFEWLIVELLSLMMVPQMIQRSLSKSG